MTLTYFTARLETGFYTGKSENNGLFWKVLQPGTCKLGRCRQLIKSIKYVTEHSRSISFHDDKMLQDQASGERCQDQWSSGLQLSFPLIKTHQLLIFIYGSVKECKAICSLLFLFICFIPYLMRFVLACQFR